MNSLQYTNILLGYGLFVCYTAIIFEVHPKYSENFYKS